MTTNSSTTAANPGRLIYGLKAIGERLGLTERQVKHLHAKNDLPTGKKGKRVCATEGALVAWLQKIGTDAGRSEKGEG